VVLVAESASLAAVLNQLLDPADRLSRLGSLRELAESRSLDTADVVVLDVAAEERTAAVGQIRRRYLGPLVILVTKGEPIAGLRLDDACGLLFRPFSADELAETLGAPALPAGWSPATAAAAPDRTPPSSNGPGVAGVAAVPAVAAARRAPGVGKPGVEVRPAGPDGPPAAPKASDPKASARQAPARPAPPVPPGRPGLLERGQRLLLALTQGWQARRRVRVAGFSFFALIAFTAAFALAAHGGRCGPGCDAFGTVFSPDPTVAPASSRGPSTTGPKRSTTTAAQTGTPSSGAFRGIAGGGVASTTTTAAGRVTTTTKKQPATTRPATTRPATTQSTAPPTTTPPTTAPPTTAPPTTAGA
jgi:hypothetical protein